MDLAMTRCCNLLVVWRLFLSKTRKIVNLFSPGVIQSLFVAHHAHTSENLYSSSNLGLMQNIFCAGPRKRNFRVEFSTKEVRLIPTSSHYLSTNFMQRENQGWLCSVTTRVETKMESSENQPSEHPTRTTCPGSCSSGRSSARRSPRPGFPESWPGAGTA